MLDSYRAQIDQLLGEGVWNAQVILREIQARGYTGKYSILGDYSAQTGAAPRSRDGAV